MTKRKASVALDANESSQNSGSQDNNNHNGTVASNNTNVNSNQGIQNGATVSGVSRRPQQAIGNGGNGSTNRKSKKERADNWSNAEIQVLHRGIETRRDIFYGPPNQATKKNREVAWHAITKEVNSVSTTPRTLNQVMKKFKNEKCRAKRKFIDTDKDVHNGSNSVTSNSATNDASLATQTHQNNQIQVQQPQQQAHHMTPTESLSAQPSINVVKLAPQNVAKTMIDLPGHVQQIQMPNEDNMLLIVPPEMDGLLSSVNIVADGNGNHHFQKCPSGNIALNGQQHNHHSQHTLQAINTGQGLVNGTVSNGMMARTIPGGMCSLVYSTGSDLCGADQHVTNSVQGPNQLASSHIGMNAQNLMHHRGPMDPNQGTPQQSQQQSHQLHQHQQQQAQQQSQSQHPHNAQHQAQHQPAHLQHGHLTSNPIGNTGGTAMDSQLKNLLINLLSKDGQSSLPGSSVNQDLNKQRNDLLAVIASSLNKIEGHLSKFTKMATSYIAHHMNGPNENQPLTNPNLSASSNNLDINNNPGNDNNVGMPGDGSANLNNQSGERA